MRIVKAVLFGACASSMPLLSAAEAGKGLSQAEVSRINEVSQAFVKAALASDWATVAALYGDDAVLSPPNEPAVKGRAAIQAFFAKFPPITALKFTNIAVEG